MVSKRLVKLMDVIVITDPEGKAKLAQAASRSKRMIERYVQGLSRPSQHIAYRLALACGCTKEEALNIAKECSSERTRRTA